MRKIVPLVVLVVGVWFVAHYLKTGEWWPGGAPQSQASRELNDLERELRDVNARLAQAGRAAGMTGMDTTAEADALLKKKEELERKIAEARKRAR